MDQTSFDASTLISSTPKNTKRNWLLWGGVGILGIVASVVVGSILWARFSPAKTDTILFTTPELISDESPTPIASDSSSQTDKQDISIFVLNGTGIAKEASFLVDKLKTIGFEKIETGNSPNTSGNTAKVSFAPSLSSEYQDEILSLLQKTYTKVEKQESDDRTYEVRITTGLRPGITRPTPNASASSVQSSASPSASPSL